MTCLQCQRTTYIRKAWGYTTEEETMTHQVSRFSLRSLSLCVFGQPRSPAKLSQPSRGDSSHSRRAVFARLQITREKHIICKLRSIKLKMILIVFSNVCRTGNADDQELPARNALKQQYSKASDRSFHRGGEASLHKHIKFSARQS